MVSDNIEKNEQINEDNVVILRASKDGIDFNQFKNFKTLFHELQYPKILWLNGKI